MVDGAKDKRHRTTETPNDYPRPLPQNQRFQHKGFPNHQLKTSTLKPPDKISKVTSLDFEISNLRIKE
ncbi:hypothetical protein COLO4_33836 [Corchorus olitorius]|uniref:Uncharacterized protein n=1 Tax=Corchorus olitorius TaxID=93759 RepID=A0A1R3GQL5_9ROSI|nr:hypothetical protein COLO4_33836 [Corchorus olitorius]